MGPTEGVSHRETAGTGMLEGGHAHTKPSAVKDLLLCTKITSTLLICRLIIHRFPCQSGFSGIDTLHDKEELSGSFSPNEG